MRGVDAQGKEHKRVRDGLSPLARGGLMVSLTVGA